MSAIYLHLKDIAAVQRAASALIAEASRLGLVLTIEQRPLQPLAMGHYETVATVQVARVCQAPKEES